MSKPDWRRAGVTHAGQLPSPTGDPTRWGGTVVTALDQVPAAAPPFADLFTIVTPQILQIAPVDGYPRNWSIVGKLSWLATIWQAAGDYPPPASASCNAFLQIIVGLGQSQLTQTICLAAGGIANKGLCNQQWVGNGGPYDQDQFYTGGAGTLQFARPFAAIGAVVGNTVAVRALYRPGVNFAATYPGARATLDLMMVPYAPGEGL